MTPRFDLFGPAHLAALAVVAAVAAGLPWLVRRRPSLARPARAALVLALAGLTAAYLVALAREGPLSIWDVLPLHLCDFLLLVAPIALVTLRPWPCELLCFWGGTGTLLATLTPDLATGWPDWRFVVYFGLHGAVVAAASLVAFGVGPPLVQGAAWRVFLVTNVYAAAVGAVDAVWGMNFLYLCGKPQAPTPLDVLGPWPAYLVVADGIALALFALLEAVFRGAWRLRTRRRAD